jgi:sec-independent protein translocase protein TatA
VWGLLKEAAVSLGLPELLVILVIIILIFGAGRLAGLGARAGPGNPRFQERGRQGRPEDPDKEKR